MAVALIVHEKAMVEADTSFSVEKKKLSPRSCAAILHARRTRNLGNVNSILTREIRLSVFLLGQQNILPPAGPDR
jgi:hypothetical protein